MRQSAARMLVFLLIVSLLCIPLEAAQPETLSAAVVSQVEQTFQSLTLKLQNGTAGASDYAQAALALKILFAHMDETGLTKRIEAYILTHPERVTEFPAERSLQESASRLTLEQRKAMHEYIRNHGLKYFHDQIVASFEVLASQAQTGNFHLAAYICPTGGNWGFALGWSSFYFGLVGLFVGGPVGLAFGIISAGTGAAVLLCA